MDQFATYCPEDNKLRLYVGRVPRDEYEKLRADGWTSTPKQACDFVAVWTPSRAATAREYSEGEILDEDQSPEDRAADRAERFSDYRDKRTAEATGHADRYDDGPTAHGFQSQARAERAAARHDRIAGYAVDAWSKAEYWQRRTAGVISHALYVSTPAVRMGRIKEIEADLRRIEKNLSDYAKLYEKWEAIAAMQPSEKTAQDERALALSYYENGSDYVHPRTGRKSYLYDFARPDEREPDPLNGAELAALWLSHHGKPASETQWTTHLRLRLAYEHQMLEAQGSRAAMIEMEPGGFFGGFQIRKVNKSAVTGRVVSVQVKKETRANFDRHGKEYGPDNPRPLTLHNLNVERFDVSAYRPPTDEEREAFRREIKEEKQAAPKKEVCPLINPSEEEAERLQEIWNARARAKHEEGNIYTSPTARETHSSQFQPAKVTRTTQAQYSAASQGNYSQAETRGLCRNAQLEPRESNMWSAQSERRAKERGPAVCKIRVTDGRGGWETPRSVIVLTDKPHKPLPPEVWGAPQVIAAPAPAPEPAPVDAIATAAPAMAQAHFGF